MSIPASLSAFANWLIDHPVAGDRTYSAQGRDGAVRAYRQYLATFDVEPTGIVDILVSIDRFYFSLASVPSSSSRQRRWNQGLRGTVRSVHRCRRSLDERVRRLRLLRSRRETGTFTTGPNCRAQAVR